VKCTKDEGRYYMKKLDNKGFSLVELIIVIAIMAVLTGLFAGMYMKYVEKAKITRQEEDARKLYDAAQAAIVEYVIDENNFGYTFESVTPKYHDSVTGKTCGRITGADLVNAGNGSVESVISSFIVENIGDNMNFANVSPMNEECNYSDDAVRVLIVFDDNGIFRLEYGKQKYFTTITGGMTETQKWSSSGTAKFSNPS